MNSRATYRDYEEIVHMMMASEATQAARQRTKSSAGPGFLLYFFFAMAVTGAAFAGLSVYLG